VKGSRIPRLFSCIARWSRNRPEDFAPPPRFAPPSRLSLHRTFLTGQCHFWRPNADPRLLGCPPGCFSSLSLIDAAPVAPRALRSLGLASRRLVRIPPAEKRLFSLNPLRPSLLHGASLWKRSLSAVLSLTKFEETFSSDLVLFL